MFSTSLLTGLLYIRLLYLRNWRKPVTLEGEPKFVISGIFEAITGKLTSLLTVKYQIKRYGRK